MNREKLFVPYTILSLEINMYILYIQEKLAFGRLIADAWKMCNSIGSR